MLSPVNWPSESRSPYRQHRDTGHRLQLAWRLPWHQYWECLWQLFINTDLGDKVDAFTLESVTVAEFPFDLHISLEEGENVCGPVKHGLTKQEIVTRFVAMKFGIIQRRHWGQATDRGDGPACPARDCDKNSIWSWMTGGRRHQTHTDQSGLNVRQVRHAQPIRSI